MDSPVGNPRGRGSGHSWVNPSHDLLKQFTRQLRGLKTRWGALQRSRVVDSQALRAQTDAERDAFKNRSQILTHRNAAEWSEAITSWDQSLDASLAYAERSTLENLGSARASREQLRLQFRKDRKDAKANHETQLQLLSQRTENARKGLAKTRDSSKGKLERERLGLEERMHEAREWIGIKTGNPTLMHWNEAISPESLSDVESIATLDQIATRFEQNKSEIDTALQRLRVHPATRLVSFPWLAGIGIAAGGLCSLVGYQLQWPPLIWGAMGLSAVILVPAILGFLASLVLGRALRRLFPPVVAKEQTCCKILQQGIRLAERHYGTEVAKLELQHAAEEAQLKSQHRSQLQHIEEAFTTEDRNLELVARRERQTLAEQRSATMKAIDRDEATRLQELRLSQKASADLLRGELEATLESLQKHFDRSQLRTTSRWKDGVASFSQRVRTARAALDIAYPDWNSAPMRTGAWPRGVDHLAWPIAHLIPSPALLGQLAEFHDRQDFVSELDLSGPIPVVFDLIHHGSLILHGNTASQETANGVVRQTLLRALTSLPAGAMHTTIIDPEGLGKRFSWIMHLADIDPTLVNHRVWTQPVHIAHQLELTARHVEDVIQQSLRNRFGNVYEYNQSAGPMTIPYRLLVWSGFPLGLDEHSWQSLCSVLSSGGRCGVGIILQIADNCKWPVFVDPNKLEEFGLHLVMRSDAASERLQDPHPAVWVSRKHSELSSLEVRLLAPPDDTVLRQVMHHHLQASANIGKRVVPFSSIAPTSSPIQEESSADGLEIPIGVADSGRTQSLRLGKGTSQHVLIAGKTGSGKSSLLHTLITSAALHYTPDQLRFVLLDFKKGVEFQVYSETQLPHADVIGIESRREFGLSTLEYLDRILSARGEAFRHWGVQDLPSLRRKHPEVKLPRILIVIDEFQEMFVEDDKLSQQASMLLDRLVRQGRSFGMHLILASQTLGGSYSLPRTTLSQMSVRIALQCDSSDAMLILSEDNTAAERLRHSGHGIYNESGGRLEGNQHFQVSFIEKGEQLQRLNALTPHGVPQHPTINPLGQRVVFEGHKPSVWDTSVVEKALSMLSAEEKSQLPWVLGDSVSIEPPVVRLLGRGAGRNAMIVGGDESLVASLFASWLKGWKHATDPVATSSPTFWILDGSRPDDTQLRQAVHWAKQFPSEFRVGDTRELETMLSELSRELSRRLNDPHAMHPPVLLFVLHLARFRELRRGDEYSFGASDAEADKPHAMLAKLLSEGPGLGMHVCLWADSASSLGRWLSRTSLRDIELRILMQMSAADSNQLIDSNQANRLDRYVLLVHDDADGKSSKFRPFLLESILGPHGFDRDHAKTDIVEGGRQL
jgi:DNA segregation ATPase FtsK/SpoIIIE, S-DNA-T family